MNYVLVFNIDSQKVLTQRYAQDGILFACQQLYNSHHNFQWAGNHQIVLAIDQELYTPGIEHFNWLFSDTGLYVTRGELRSILTSQEINPELQNKFALYGHFSILKTRLRTFKIKKIQ